MTNAYLENLIQCFPYLHLLVGSSRSNSAKKVKSQKLCCGLIKCRFPVSGISRAGEILQRSLSSSFPLNFSTGTVRGGVEKSFKPGFHMIATVIVSICRRLIWETSPMCRSRSPTVATIWKPSLMCTQPTGRSTQMTMRLHDYKLADHTIGIRGCKTCISA